ncbi:hypothetical protein BTA51_25920 [Hahella sp. CCB-MM4]|uniref:hypothetical protein n=1 Tax=Hahella sp. (strain CCB-MM4) TaxID=1926491 RepID=UPI000B9BA413|nr:hypothetical protein [Hahella sp. CCB-MM4]OZG70408.1 hypothetical protein BTA51_25920 [Hahella sp. CCB-MM4]
MLTIIEQTADNLLQEIDMNNDIRNLGGTERIVGDAFHVIVTSLQEIRSTTRVPNFGRDDAHDLIISMQTLSATCELLSYNLDFIAARNVASHNPQQAATQTITSVKNWISAKLIPLINGIWQSVWAVLAKYVTPKEWTVSGELGTPVLGLAKATVGITFG